MQHHCHVTTSRPRSPPRDAHQQHRQQRRGNDRRGGGGGWIAATADGRARRWWAIFFSFIFVLAGHHLPSHTLRGRGGVILIFDYYPHVRSQAPACEGCYFSINMYVFYVHKVGLDRRESVDNWLWPQPAITGCQTGPDRKEPVSCGPVQFCLDFECGRTGCGPGSF
jgi:hypothetical protein